MIEENADAGVACEMWLGKDLPQVDTLGAGVASEMPDSSTPDPMSATGYGGGGLPIPVYEVVTSHSRAAEVCELLSAAPIVALDIETYSTQASRAQGDKPAIDPFRNHVRLVQLAMGTEKVFIFDLLRLRSVPDGLLRLLADDGPAFIGFNLRFDAKVILHHFGVSIPAPVDLYAAAVLVEGYRAPDADDDEDGWFTLASVVRRYLGWQLDKEEQLSDWGRSELTRSQLFYAALDVAVLFPLYERLAEAAGDVGVRTAWQIENGVLVPLAAVELAGIQLDTKMLKKLSSLWGKKARRTYARAVEALGHIDLDSPDQLRRAFVERLGLSLPSTDEATLNELASDVPAALDVLTYRRYQKLQVTYGQTWLQLAGRDGRLRATFRSLGSGTGRMRCSSPNIQAVPREKGARDCFVPSEGHSFVIADYSAIELRVIAQLIGDRELRRCFCSETPIDPHRRTASFLTGKLPRDVSKDERDRAKPMNFGFAFGMSADTFVSYARDNYGLTFSSSEARVLRHRFFGLYWGVGAWHKRINYQGRRSLEARTASGRLRKFDTFKMTEMLNTPIQGTAADGIKRGMALLYPKLDQVKGRVVNVIHDELIVEVPTEYAEVARGLVEGAMIAGMQEFLPDVPVAVESGVADKWKKV